VSADAPPTGDDALRHRVARHRAHERVRRPGHRQVPTSSSSASSSSAASRQNLPHTRVSFRWMDRLTSHDQGRVPLTQF